MWKSPPQVAAVCSHTIASGLWKSGDRWRHCWFCCDEKEGVEWIIQSQLYTVRRAQGPLTALFGVKQRPPSSGSSSKQGLLAVRAANLWLIKFWNREFKTSVGSWKRFFFMPCCDSSCDHSHPVAVALWEQSSSVGAPRSLWCQGTPQNDSCAATPRLHYVVDAEILSPEGFHAMEELLQKRR